MTVFWLIMKIIGLILLAIVGLLLLLVLLFLFCPFIYYGEISKNDTGFSGWIKAHWLFHILRVYYCFPDADNNKISILWKNLLSKNKVEDSSEIGASVSKADLSEKSNDNTCLEVDSFSDEQSNDNALKEQAENTISDDKTDQDSMDADPIAEDTVQEDRKNIQYTITRLYDKIRLVVSEIEYYSDFLNDPETIGLIDNVVRRFKGLIRTFAPKRIDGQIDYCTGAPDTAAYVFGLYVCLLYPHKGRFVLTPDMNGDNKYFKGDVRIRGRVIPFNALFNMVLVLLDRRLWRTKKKIQEHRKKTNG